MDKDYRFIPFSDLELSLMKEGLMMGNGRVRRSYEYGESNDKRIEIGQGLVEVIDAELKERKERKRIREDTERKAREIRCDCCNLVTGYKNA